MRKEKLKKEAGVKEEVEELTRLDGSSEDVVLIKKEVKSPVTASEFLFFVAKELLKLFRTHSNNSILAWPHYN